MGDYHALMAQLDQEVRNKYTFDPRVAVHNASRYAATKIEPFTGAPQISNTPVDTTQFPTTMTGSHSDANIVQSPPRTVPVKRYIIIDTSQRDWIKQPNPYTNLVFAFGMPGTVASNPPVYTNNPFVPTFAVEQSNLPTPIPGIPNNQGWTLPASPSNIPYPAYNSSLPSGNFIGYDTGYIVQPSGAGFGSVFTPCNVQAIRLVRAVLPQRQFLNLAIVPRPLTDASTSDYIQSNVANNAFSTFTTYPYLLFYLNEYFGQYVGGNEPMRRCFSVLTQKRRGQINFQSAAGVDQFDYEPWNAEALQFQSPLTNLQKLQVSVTDPNGSNFPQSDSLTVSLIQATADQTYLKCFTGSFQYFSGNDLHVGDRITFYSNTLTAILKSPILASMNTDNTTFVQSLVNANFPVLQLLDYVMDSNGIFNPRDASDQRTAPYVSSYNGFMIPNFTTIDVNGNATIQYPGAIDAGSSNVLEPNALIGSNIPFLNVSLQPVYTLELDILQPDTGSIGGRIVL
jgi:hypothetical protein